ncbi:ATP-binding cassette domain-containing protein [Lactobacillus sp. ESL0791]|uniref:ATP-binding cassette domain-containing protein n=1 Tax=Lactobacillus sp. ESL0791 TaxID=2983234 RepID=UPI0023F8155B|nr:ATP-binding cassette domain-containing protein [Lactobacillus sp. ESL0791]MDF7638662.1 ATP-binding cassette domain-containing protein [Lactobacillus sp. ESL0791]
MEFIKIIDVNINYNGKDLFTIPDLKISGHEKIGLIGENGAGKTTLMKAINHFPAAAKGQIIKNCSVVYVPQLLAQSEKSGGEREKIAVSEALFQLRQSADSLLMLDEPTSNLDEHQQEWLISQLQALPNPMLLISHDRHFLNRVVNEIWDLKDQKITQFKGSYADYEAFIQTQEEKKRAEYKRKDVKRKRLQRDYEQRISKAKKIKKKKKGVSVSDWKSHGDYDHVQRKMLRSTRVLANRLKAETDTIEKPYEKQPITLKNVTADLASLEIPTKTNLLSINPQTVAVKERKLFALEHELRVTGTAKISLVGDNGAGKSVFLTQLFNKQLAGLYNDKLQVGLFNQDVTKSLSAKTLLETIMAETIFDRSSTMQLLGDLHLQEAMKQPVDELSGGQLVCFNLAMILVGQYNLLLLDEPTNFLDISAIEALSDFIKNYPFAVIIVSHDKRFVSDLGLTKWQIKDGQLLNGAYLGKHAKTNSNELALLKFKRDQMLADPNVSFAEIAKITEKLQQLQ